MRRGNAPEGYSRAGVWAGESGQMLDFLARRFPRVDVAVWRARIARGEVLDAQGRPVRCDTRVEGLSHVFYRRTPEQEAPIPFEAQVLYQDAHLVVADKPHFLPTAPGGQYVEQTLLTRLQRQLRLPRLAPLHRLDKDTAGLVLLSPEPAGRDAWHTLFRSRTVRKLYEAVAPWRAELELPRTHASRMEEGGARFFTMHEVPGAPNSQTHIEMAARSGAWALYRLRPVTGKKHQLRLHMAALGAPIRHDAFYPEINDPPPGDYSRPLQLLARELAFTDPVSGRERVFVSQQRLQWPVQEENAPYADGQ